MQRLFLLPLLIQMGCTQQIKIRIEIIDSGLSDFDDDIEPTNEPSGSSGTNPEPTNEPSGDPNGGDPNGGDPGGNPEPSQEAGAEPSQEVGAEPSGEPGDGGGSPGVFDSCDASVYCVLAGEDSANFNNFFNEQQTCTSSSGDATYDDWFTCVTTSKGDPCSGAGGGDWSGCDCTAVQACADDYPDPFE